MMNELIDQLATAVAKKLSVTLQLEVPLLISLPDAAKRLGCDANHIRSLLETKQIVGYNLADDLTKRQSIRITISSLLKFLEDRKLVSK